MKFPAVASWRNESSNVSLVVLDKMLSALSKPGFFFEKLKNFDRNTYRQTYEQTHSVIWSLLELLITAKNIVRCLF